MLSYLLDILLKDQFLDHLEKLEESIFNMYRDASKL